MEIRKWFEGWSKRKRETEEIPRVNSRDPGILCNEDIEKILGSWLDKVGMPPRGLSRFLDFLEYKTPIKMYELNLWNQTSVTCEDANGKKTKLIVEKERNGIYIEAIDVFYTAQEIKDILSLFY